MKYIAAPLEGSQKQLDKCRHVFFMWESACVIHREKCYFLAPTVVDGKQVSKTTSVSKVKLIKVTIWKVHALIFRSVGAAWEFKKCACVILEVNFPLWSVSVQKCMQHSTQKSRWISQLNLPVIKLYQHNQSWGIRPNCFSFETYWCYCRLMQNEGWCQE